MEVALLVGGGVLSVAFGYAIALLIMARDKRFVRVPEDCLIIKTEVFEKLKEISEVKKKNRSIKFDSRGVMTGVAQDDDDEDVE